MMKLSTKTWSKLSAAILLTDTQTMQPAIGVFLFSFDDQIYQQLYQTTDGYYVFIKIKPKDYNLKIYSLSNSSDLLLETSITIPEEPTNSNSVYNYQITV